MDVRNETGLSLPFVVMHEGTGERPVSLTVSGVQEPDLIYPAILNSPEDQWSRTVNESGPFTLSGQGTENDTVYLHWIWRIFPQHLTVRQNDLLVQEPSSLTYRSLPKSADSIAHATTDLHHRSSRLG